MGRVYAAPFNIAAFGTAAGDLIHISAAAETPLAIHSITIGQQDSETNEMLGILLARQTTAGSGGTVEAGEPLLPNDAADSATVRVGDSTDATGTSTEMFRDTFSVLSGWQYLPAPEDRIIVSGTTVPLVMSITDTPVVNMDIQGVIVYEELV